MGPWLPLRGIKLRTLTTSDDSPHQTDKGNPREDESQRVEVEEGPEAN